MKRSRKKHHKRGDAILRSQCPHCFHVLDTFSSLYDENIEVRPGDYTVCLYCENVLEFDKDLHLISATDETLKKIAGTKMFLQNNAAAGILAERLQEKRRNQGSAKDKPIDFERLKEFFR